MRRRSFTLTCLLVGLLLTSGLPAAIPGAQARQVMPDPDSETMGLPLSFPEPTWDEAGGYINLQLDGATGNVRVAGAPLLPMWGRMLGFPVGTRILEVFLSNTTYTENTITRTVLPAPEPVPMVAGAEESVFEGPAYSQSALYPSGETDYTVTTGMGEQGGIEAHLFVKVFPVRYNPVSGLVRVLRTADLDIRFESPPVRAPPANETYDILVLAPPEFESEMGRYKAHKEEVGFSVKLVNLTAVYAGSIFNVSAGRDNPEKIKLFIKQALENWTIRYVVLTGDVEKFPVRRAYFLDYYDSSNLPTDLYYEDIYKAGTKTFCDWDKDRDNLFAECYPSTNPDAVDLDPDVTVGRLPAGSESELRGMINKTISYAENVTRGNWFQNLTLVGTDTFGPSRGETSGVAEGEYACDVAYAYLPGFNASKFYEKKGTFSISAIRDCLNRGAGYAIFANHGATDGVCYPDSGGGPGLSSSNAASLTNGPRLPLSVLDACSTHAIDSNDCLGENLVLNPRGGSINSIGATRVAYGGWSTWHVQGNSGYLNVHLAEQFGKGTIMPGVMLGRAKQSYMANVGIWDYADMKTMIQYIGLGDPVTFIGGPGIASTADNQTKWADPGATAEFQITVSNSALHPDEVQLSLVGSRWSAGLNTSFLKLASNASSNVTLRMSVDALADAFEWNNLTVNLLCKSTGLPVRLNLSVRTNCIRKVGFSAGGDGSGALPGSGFGLNYTIKNDGNVFENATLAVTGGGPSWSLNTTFPAGEVARRSVQQGCLTLPVSARALAGSYRFQVRLTTDSGIVLDAPLNIEVLRTFGFDIRVETGHAFPDANGAAFRMEVENLGNHPDNCTLAPAGIPAGWTVECPPGMDLEAFAQEAVGCTIMPDEHALAGDYAFQICLYSSEGLLETLNLAVTVNRTSKLQLRCPVDAQAAGQGSDAVFEVVIDSSSNFYEPVELSVQRMPDGWGWFLVSEPLGVEPFSSASAFIAISAPDRCPAGLYLVDVVASTAQWRALRSLSVEIRAERAFIACPDTSQAVLHPGDDASFMVNVQNLGNCRDRYLLGAEGSLPVSFSANLVGIDARSSETFEVVVSVPGTARHGLYELALTVSSTADPALRMTFTIRIMVEKISDMAVEIDTASDVQSGSTGAFWVAATNLGTEEETLVLSGRDLPDWGFSCPADAIPPGKTRRLQVTFTIPAGTAGGSYDLSLVASTDAQSFPMDHLVEVAAPVSLAASGGAGPAAPSLLPYAAAAVIVVLPTAVAALVWRNRRKKGPAGAQCAQPSDLPAPAAPPPSPPPPPAVIPTYSPVPQLANYDSQLPLPPPPPPEYLQAGYTALANPLPPPPPWFSPPAQ